MTIMTSLTLMLLVSSVDAFFTTTVGGVHPSSVWRIAPKNNALLSSSQRSSTMKLFSTVKEDTTAPSSPTTSSSSLSSSSTVVYTPIFDFSLDNLRTKQKSANSFERIDDAIMGGISTSTLRDVPNRPYAIWSGMCRTDGGGFCGLRTLPFGTTTTQTSSSSRTTTTTTATQSLFLNATGQDGVYIDCQLASDNEAYRRVWKMTLRTEASRGEKVYQAEYNLQEAMNEASLKEEGQTNGSWARVMIPFNDFQLVRGPRLIPNSPKIVVASSGIYQIGMTMSKFKMAITTTEIDNFRSGYFELQIQRIGFYTTTTYSDNAEKNDVLVNDMSSNNSSSMMAVVPDTLSKSESMKRRPMVLKLLLPIIRLILGTEQTSRRKSAMRILRTSRGMSRLRAIQFGFQYHRKSFGTLGSSIGKTMRILIVDAFRTVIRNALMITLVYPLRLMGSIINRMKSCLGMKVEPTLRE